MTDTLEQVKKLLDEGSLGMREFYKILQTRTVEYIHWYRLYHEHLMNFFKDVNEENFRAKFNLKTSSEINLETFRGYLRGGGIVNFDNLVFALQQVNNIWKKLLSIHDVSENDLRQYKLHLANLEYVIYRNFVTILHDIGSDCFEIEEIEYDDYLHKRVLDLSKNEARHFANNHGAALFWYRFFGINNKRIPVIQFADAFKIHLLHEFDCPLLEESSEFVEIIRTTVDCLQQDGMIETNEFQEFIQRYGPLNLCYERACSVCDSAGHPAKWFVSNLNRNEITHELKSIQASSTDHIWALRLGQLNRGMAFVLSYREITEESDQVTHVPISFDENGYFITSDNVGVSPECFPTVRDALIQAFQLLQWNPPMELLRKEASEWKKKNLEHQIRRDNTNIGKVQLLQYFFRNHYDINTESIFVKYHENKDTEYGGAIIHLNKVKEELTNICENHLEKSLVHRVPCRKCGNVFLSQAEFLEHKNKCVKDTTEASPEKQLFGNVISLYRQSSLTKSSSSTNVLQQDISKFKKLLVRENIDALKFYSRKKRTLLEDVIALILKDSVWLEAGILDQLLRSGVDFQNPITLNYDNNITISVYPIVLALCDRFPNDENFGMPRDQLTLKRIKLLVQVLKQRFTSEDNLERIRSENLMLKIAILCGNNEIIPFLFEQKLVSDDLLIKTNNLPQEHTLDQNSHEGDVYRASTELDLLHWVITHKREEKQLTVSNFNDVITVSKSILYKQATVVPFTLLSTGIQLKCFATEVTYEAYVESAMLATHTPPNQRDYITLLVRLDGEEIPLNKNNFYKYVNKPKCTFSLDVFLKGDAVNVFVVKELLRYLHHINLQAKIRLLEGINKNGESALISSVKAGFTNLSEMLLEMGSNIKAIDNERRSILHFLIDTWSSSKLKKLFFPLDKNNTMVNSTDIRNKTPIQYLLETTCKHTLGKGLSMEELDKNILLLLEKGASLRGFEIPENRNLWLKLQEVIFNRMKENEKDCYFIPARAVTNENIELLKLVLEPPSTKHQPPFMYYSDESPLLHIAVAQESPEMVAMLLSYHKLHDIKNYHAIKSYITNSYLELDINRYNNRRQTALHSATKTQRRNASTIEITRLLLNRNIRLELVDASGYSALHYACERGQLEMVDDIIRKHDNLELVSEATQGTPLHLASNQGHWQIVEALLKAGAKPNVLNSEGKTALTLALESTEKIEKEMDLLEQKKKKNLSSYTYNDQKLHLNYQTQKEQYALTMNSLENHGADIETAWLFLTGVDFTKRFFRLFDHYKNLKKDNDNKREKGQREAALLTQAQNAIFQKKTNQIVVRKMYGAILRLRHVIGCLVYMGFLALLTIVGIMEATLGNPYWLSKALHEQLVNEEFLKNDSHVFKTFEDIDCIDEFWMWCRGPFHNVFYPDNYGMVWNGSNTAVSRGIGYINGHNKILGVPRLRQHRRSLIPCEHIDILEYCLDNFDDTKDYGDPDDPYKYENALDIEGLPTWGLTGTWYSGGGYIQNLPAIGPETRNQDSLIFFNNLQSEHWIDSRTSMVTMEFTLYNGNLHLIVYGQMIVEFPSTGGAVPQVNYQIHPAHRYLPQGKGFFLMIGELVLLTCFSLYFINELLQLKRDWGQYLKSWYNRADATVHILFVIVVFLHLTTIYYEDDERFIHNPSINTTQHITISLLSNIYRWEIDIFTIVILISYFKLLELLTCFENITKLVVMIEMMIKEMQTFFFLLLGILIAFSTANVILFGYLHFPSREWGYSLLDQIRKLFSDSDMYIALSQDRLMGAALSILFSFFLGLLLMNLIIAILATAYEKAQSKVGECYIAETQFHKLCWYFDHPDNIWDIIMKKIIKTLIIIRSCFGIKKDKVEEEEDKVRPIIKKHRKKRLLFKRKKTKTSSTI